jgi:hypothetical protein
VFVSHLAINIITRTQGANIEGSDPRGYTPLHLAAMEGHSVVCQLLLGYSAPIEARDKVRVHLRACVCLIASRGLGAISRSYSGRKRPPPPTYNRTRTTLTRPHNLATQDGNTPLILACTRGHHPAVDRLVNGGADLNAVNNRQRTALMCACEVGLTASVKLLVNRCVRAVQPSHAITPRPRASRCSRSVPTHPLKVVFTTICGLTSCTSSSKIHSPLGVSQQRPTMVGHHTQFFHS